MQPPPKQKESLNQTSWTILKLLRWATSYFKKHDIESPRASAEILLAHALKVNRIDLYIRYDQPLSINELSRFKDLLKRRAVKEPVAYIVGAKEFWTLKLAVSPDVLIPRPETERLVEAALLLLSVDSNFDSGPGPKRILDLGTGSGAIILALASERPKQLFFATDRSFKTVEVARKNARRHHLDKRIHFFSGDWFSPLSDRRHRFDLIISNPPYIPTRVISTLQPDIHQYEPSAALDGGRDGLFALNHLIFHAHRYLIGGGYLMLEIGDGQKNAVWKIAEKSGHYEPIVFMKDDSGRHRVAQMKKKP